MKTIKVGIVGDFQSGKSTLINCLFGRSIASVGDGTATTHTAVTYRYSEKESIQYVTDGKKFEAKVEDLCHFDSANEVSEITAFVNTQILKDFTLVDMPGFNFNDCDNQVADRIVKTLDLAIVVSTNVKAIGGTESSLFITVNKLKRYRVPYYFVMNCTDVKDKKWFPTHRHNQEIMEENLNFLSFYKPQVFPFDDSQVLIVNFLWYWYVAREDDEIIKANSDNLIAYGIRNKVFEQKILDASNFNTINQIFSMDNKIFLELRKEFKQEIERFRDEVCPVGTIQTFAFCKEQEGWLPCDGRTVNKNEYPELFYAIGFTFGGDNNEQFQLPDLRGRFVRGWDNVSVLDKDRLFGSLQEDSFQDHKHKIGTLATMSSGQHTHKVYYSVYKVGSNVFENDKTVYEVSGSYSSSHSYGGDPGTNFSGDHNHTVPEHTTIETISKGKEPIRIDQETRPKNIALQYCIKAINSFQRDK